MTAVDWTAEYDTFQIQRVDVPARLTSFEVPVKTFQPKGPYRVPFGVINAEFVAPGPSFYQALFDITLEAMPSPAPEVEMEMWHVLTAGLAIGTEDVDRLCVHRALYSGRDAPRDRQAVSRQVFRHVEQRLVMVLRHDESVALAHWLDVQKCQCPVILVDQADHLLPANDSAEYAAVLDHVASLDLKTPAGSHVTNAGCGPDSCPCAYWPAARPGLDCRAAASPRCRRGAFPRRGECHARMSM